MLKHLRGVKWYRDVPCTRDEWLTHWESEIVLALDRFLGCGNELKELQIISLERLQNPKG
jgi:hypothetical protein